MIGCVKELLHTLDGAGDNYNAVDSFYGSSPVDTVPDSKGFCFGKVMFMAACSKLKVSVWLCHP